MKIIRKYPIRVGSLNEHLIPRGAKFLHADVDPAFFAGGSYRPDRLAIWFEIDDSLPADARTFVVAGEDHGILSQAVLGAVVTQTCAYFIQEIL